MAITESAAVLEVSDLEFVPERVYAAFHGCDEVIIAKGTDMRTKLDEHTEVCTWMEPTA